MTGTFIITVTIVFSLMKMTDYYNFCDFNCNSLNEGKIKQYIDLMKKKYISYWNQTLQHSQKLSFYYTFKKNYSLSAYLDLTRKNPSRKSLVKLRISCHKLRIETGRYNKIPRDERLCFTLVSAIVTKLKMKLISY